MKGLKELVLILILLEVGLLVRSLYYIKRCFDFSLNPYSTGSWVAGERIYEGMFEAEQQVLILILLEVGLLDLTYLEQQVVKTLSVLILILLEVGLLEFEKIN